MNPSNPITPAGAAANVAAPAQGGAGFVKPGAEETVHHRGHRKKPAPPKMELNMTSMIDIVFQLLIYFVITCNFVPGEGILKATMPAGTGSAQDVPKLESPIKIIVSSRGETGYRLDVDKSSTAPSTFGDLKRLLDGMQEKNGGSFPDTNPIIIQPTPDVRWQHVVNAFNAAMAARYSNIAFGQASSGGE
jgi:biopolymer transport protein ExbD